MSKNISEESKTSTIAAGVEIVGEIKANGNIRIDGTVKGNITLTGKLVVVNTGVIEGDVQCKNANIAGKFDGKINVEETLTLHETANLHGDIVTDKLVVENGAVFTGTCNMDRKGSSSQPSQSK